CGCGWRCPTAARCPWVTRCCGAISRPAHAAAASAKPPPHRCVSKRSERRGQRLHSRFAGGDGFLAGDQEAGALDDRHIDHLAADADRADTLGERLVVGRDNAATMVDLLRAWAEFLVEDRDLARMDHRCAKEAEPA